MDNNKKNRRHHSPEDKVRILRLHLLEGKPISEICDTEGIHPTQFYLLDWTCCFGFGRQRFQGS
jgi:transposase-like protein